MAKIKDTAIKTLAGALLVWTGSCFVPNSTSLVKENYQPREQIEEKDEAKNNPLEKKVEEKIISEDFLNFISWRESLHNTYPDSISSAGAMGRMQIMPEIWEHYMGSLDSSKIFDPKINYNVAKKYLKDLEKYCSRNHPNWNKLSLEEKREIIAASYNGGPTRLRNRGWDISKMPKETQDYVADFRKQSENF